MHRNIGHNLLKAASTDRGSRLQQTVLEGWGMETTQWGSQRGESWIREQLEEGILLLTPPN